jgi:hypothetical protein
MRVKMILAVAVAALALPLAVRAEEAPTIVLKVKSLEGILADARYIAKLAGQEEALKQAEGVLGGFKGPDGLYGIDVKRPIGLYATITAGLTDSSAVLLIPIANEKAFLEFLESPQLMLKPKKDDDGVYAIENLPIPNLPVAVPGFFRFENKYMYFTAMEKGNIDKKKLLDPAKVLANISDIVSLQVNVAEIPDLLKQIALTQIENVITGLKEKKDANEPPAVTKLKEQVLDFVNNQLKAVLNDGESLSLKFGVDAKKDDIALDFAFKAKAGTQLAKDMAAAGKAKTLFAGLATKNDAITVNGTVNIPEEIKKTLAPAIEAAIKQAVEEEKDQVKQALMKKAAESLMPTLKAGEIDAGFSMRGPDKDGHFTGVGGLKLKEGKGIEAFLRDVIKQVPEKDKAKITVDAASAGDVKIHKVTADDMGEDAKKIFGSDAIYFAIRDDALLFAMGADGLAAIKEAATVSAGESKAALNVVISVARAAAMDVKEQKAAKAAKDVFGSDPKGADAITITATLTDSLNLKVNVKGKVITFGTKAAGVNNE